MTPNRPEPLTDEGVWDILQRCMDVIGESTGETSLADSTLDLTRRLLVNLQMALLYKIDGLDSPGEGEIEVRFISVPLIPEIETALRNYALERHPRMDITEVLAFIIGRQMALSGYFTPKK